MSARFASIVVLLFSTATPWLAGAATRFVSVSNANPQAPYNTWAKAANTIQDAVDAANPGDEVLVTNGVYASGGHVVYGTVTNRVAVTKSLVVRSVNGPQATSIVGYQVPGAIFGPSAVRCVYLTNGALLSGFTITNGASRWGGEEPPAEDTWGGGVWCESTSAIVSNCVVVNNQGGNQGGGVYQGTIYDSTIRSNATRFYGGGVFAGVLHRCSVIGNVASYFNNYGTGGGVYGSELRGCVLTGNAADIIGGGAWGGTLINCTLTLNTAPAGGGAYDSSLTNCLVYFNTAVSDPNFVGTNLSFCCTTPLPAGGGGNFTNQPALADLWHLSAGSPCRAAGTAAAVSGTDIDRQAWLNPPSVGADEFYAGASGPLSVSLSANWTNVAVGVTVQLTSQITGHAAANVWSFGDGATATNQIIASHSWAAPGDYPVVLMVFNTNFPGGVSATVVVHVDATPRYVALNNPAPAWPHNSWTTAATNIQDAVDAAPVGGLVLVSNGVYATGGRAVDYYATMTNRVAVTIPLTLQSVNGPAVTSIQGYQIPVAINGSSAVRCVYLCDGARLNGFTLTNGATLSAGFSPPIVYGGGALCQSAAAVISNCVFVGNSCIDSGAGAALGTIYNSTFLSNSAYQGGAVSDATLFGCTLSGNRASDGGGAARSVLTDCLVTNNASLGMYNRGGGVYYCSLTNCQLLANTSQDYAGGAHASTLVNCLIAGNTAPYQGGGALESAPFNCLVRGNSCSQFGGGLYGGIAYNCTVVLNSAGFQGGGANGSTFYNSIVYDNSAGAPASSNYQGGTFYFSCTSPSVGTNNILGPPDFVGALTGDFRLQSGSPCVNAGNNTYAPSGTDLGGRPRILGGTVDLGAYEYEPPPPGPPFVHTPPPIRISSTSMALRGMATPNGLSSDAWFEYGERGSYTTTTAPISIGNGYGVVFRSAMGPFLIPGKVYQCRLVVSNAAGIRYGAPQFFGGGRRALAWGCNDYNQTNLPPVLGDVMAVEAGGLHSLVLKTNGTVVAWGYNNYGQTNVPSGLDNVSSIAAGYYHNLAVRPTEVVAWGNHFDRSTGAPATPPAGLSNVVSVAGGGSHSVALNGDGTVVAWGFNYFGQTNVPAGLDNVVAVACGYEHSLALRDNGTVVAWGYNDYGQTNVPVGLTNVVAVAAGHWFSLALKADGTVVAWGDNTQGATNVPVGLSNVVAISGGTWHAVALKADGSVVTWGAGVPGANVFPAGFSNACAVSAGGNHNLALVDNTPPEVLPLAATGPANHDVVITLSATDRDKDNFSFRVVSLPSVGALYQYDNGTRGVLVTTNAPVTDPSGRVIFAPAPNEGGTPYAVFNYVANDGAADSAPAPVTLNLVAAAPFAHTQPALQITTNGATLVGMATPNGLAATAWFEWRTATGVVQSTSPQAVVDGLNVVAFSAPLSGLARGEITRFQLVVSNLAGVARGVEQVFVTGGKVTAWGYNDTGQTNVPAGLRDVVQVSGGSGHSLALRADGVLFGWGGSQSVFSALPVGVSNLVSMSAGADHGVGLRADGTVTAWGDYFYGQTNVPAGLSNVVAVAGGGNHSLALLADGTLRAWGQNHVGQATIPDGLSNVVAIAAGWYHNLALRHDGTVVSWGNNYDGQTNVPVGLTNVVRIAAGNYHSLALLRDGTLVGWGSNAEGQLSTPPGLTNIVSLQARALCSAALLADGMIRLWGSTNFNQTVIPVSVTNVGAFAPGFMHALAVIPNRAPAAQPLLLSGPANADTIVQLSGADADRDTLSFRIQTLPLLGSLYQLTNGTRGSLIVSNGTSVADAQGRLTFAPATGGFGNPYDSFAFTAEDGEAASAPATVTLAIIAPLRVFSLPASGIHTNDVTLNGFVSPNGFAAAAWFEWGTNLNYGQSTAPMDAGSSSSVVNVRQTLSGLVPGQVIHFRLVASNVSQTVTGVDQQFITGGKVRAWGDNSSGQSVMPTNQGTVVAVAGGLSHSLALRADGTVKGWGNNTYAQGGAPASLSNVVAVAAGGFHNVALRSDGTAFAWGRNNFNQTNVSAGATNGLAVAAGGQHSVLLRADGSVVAWGDNSQGQRTVPASLTNAVAVAAGWYHNVALRGDGTVTAWGGNTYAQSSVPAGLSNVVWVGAGFYHSLARRADGSLVAWGLNSSGQTNVPGGLSNVFATACGGSHNLAANADGSLIGWGSTVSGQTTTPAGVSNIVLFAGGGSHSLALVPDRGPTALNQLASGFVNADLLITLAGSDPDNDVLAFRVTSLPSAGALYQFDNATRGAQIGLADTAVTDAAGRLWFAPAPNQVGAPYAAFNFTAHDEFISSAPAQVSIDLGLPAAPVLDASASGLATDGAFQLALTGSTNAAYRVWASTNLLDWEELGLTTPGAPGWSLFLDAAATNWPQRFYRATAP